MNIVNNNTHKNSVWYFHQYATLPTLNGLYRPYLFGKVSKDCKYTVFASSYQHYSETNVITDDSEYIEKLVDGVKFVFISTHSSKGSIIRRIMGMLEYAYKANKVAVMISKHEQERPDIIVASSPDLYTLVLGICLGKKFRKPVICEVRDLWPENLFNKSWYLREGGLIGRLGLFIEHWCYKKADAIVFTKEGDKDHILEQGWDTEHGGDINITKCNYINNGVDLSSINDKIQKYTIKDDDYGTKFVVTYVGAIRSTNNIDIILDAAKSLIARKDIVFHIYGDGNLVDKMNKRIVDENISNVKYKGYIENKFVPFVLSKSFVNLLNYGNNYNWTRGCSSNKLFDYMASGKPIISTVKMGYSPIVNYKCGIELDENSGKCLSKAILRMLSLSTDEYMKLCENAKKASLDYDITRLSEKYSNVIIRLINGGDKID